MGQTSLKHDQFAGEYELTHRAAEFLRGGRAAVPITLGYLPVAFAFGAAASAGGFGPGNAMAISAIMFSAASQFFLLTAVSSGFSAFMIVGICAVLALRHLLYGFALRGRIGDGAARLFFAAGLTDEVFATTMASGGDRDANAKPGGLWLCGLAFFAWASWTGGTLVGALAGDFLKIRQPELASALQFALPALFLGLVWVSASAKVLLPMAAAAVIALAFTIMGHSELAIPAGGFAALLAKRG